MEALKKIGVVTVTYNSAFVINDFMESILKQSYLNWVLYVIDNDSKDNTLELLATYSQDKIKIIANNTNYGVAKGNNQGIAEALSDNCEYILLLNNDTVFNQNLICVLLQDLIDNSADMSSPKMMYFDPSNLIWCAGGSFTKEFPIKNIHHGENQKDCGQFNSIYQCDYVPTCCVLVKSNLFQENFVGMMDEKYFVYYDDTDWMWRAKMANNKLIYTPNTVLYHKVSSLTGKTSDFTVKMITRNRVYFILKNFSGITKLTELFLGLVYIVVGPLLGKHKMSSVWFRLNAYIDGFKLRSVIEK